MNVPTPYKGKFFLETFDKFYLVDFFGRLIEALTACLGAVGHSSPTLVGEGLSNEDDSN